MNCTHPARSIGWRIFHMSLTWLILGAMIGAIGGIRSGAVIQLVSGALGGMIVLPFAGVFLGLLGGDARGSVVGAAGGLMGCWLAKPACGISLDPASVEVVVLFGALAGATCLLYFQLLRWGYGILFRSACQCVGVTWVPGQPSLPAGHFGFANEQVNRKSRLIQQSSGTEAG